MSTTNVALLRAVPPRDEGPNSGASPIGTLLGLIAFSLASAVLGLAVEHYRPGGSLWQQTQALSLASRISRMQRTACCHD